MGSEGMTSLVVGATGAIGKEVVRELVNSPRISKIKIITRRHLEINSNKIEENVIDFEELSSKKDIFSGVQVAFCCIGTTRSKAGSDGFVKVDRDYVCDIAKILKENGCSHFNLVSSQGANTKSSFLYLKTKGEAEEMISELDFPRVSIYRPGLLICDRQESRPFEKIMQIAAKGFDWRNKLSIPVETVAHAMVTNSFLESSSKVEVIEHKDINKLGID